MAAPLKRRVDLPPPAVRVLLAPLGALWCGVAAARVAAYRRGWKRRVRPPFPTLSIGNLSVGGTGKTPLLIHAVDWLTRHDAEVGVLSRGHGGDEGRMLEARFPALRLAEDPDRVRGLRSLLLGGRPDVLLLDDGFQHLRLERDYDVVLLDATRPFDRCLPAGRSRESPRALRRATHVVLSRAELVGEAERRAVWERVHAIRAGLPRVAEMEGDVEPFLVRNLRTGEERPLASLRGARAHLAAGVGHPESFRALCERLGVEVVGADWKPDHHPWSDADVAAWPRDVDVLVTEKDGVKLHGWAPDHAWEVLVRWRFTRGADHFHGLLAELQLPSRAARIEPLWAAHAENGGGFGAGTGEGGR